MAKLDPNQEKELKELAYIDKSWRDAKMTLEATLRAQLRVQIESIEIDRAKKVIRLLEMGIPKSRVGSEGLHTKDPRAADKVRDEYSALIDLVKGDLTEDGKQRVFWWDDAERLLVRVDYPNAKSLSNSSKWTQLDSAQGVGFIQREYPDTITGTLKRHMDGERKWEVLTDGNTTRNSERMVELGYPTVAGPLDQEANYGEISAMLEEWWVENS